MMLIGLKWRLWMMLFDVMHHVYWLLAVLVVDDYYLMYQYHYHPHHLAYCAKVVTHDDYVFVVIA